MEGLAFLKENVNPNLEQQALANLNSLRHAHSMMPVGAQDSAFKGSATGGGYPLHATDGINYDTQSIQSIAYN